MRLTALFADGYPTAKLEANITKSKIRVVSPQGATPFVLNLITSARTAKKLSAVQLIVTSTGREAEELSNTLSELDPTCEVLEFPSWETLPHERLSPSPETVGKRVRVLQRLHQLQTSKVEHSVYVLASIRATLQPVVAGLGEHPALRFFSGQEYLLPELNLKLVELAYERVDMVTRRGEFATRGGILDIFPTTAEHAVRLEFFGDELEEIREFSVSDQRSLPHASLASIEIFPAREVIITPSVAAKAREMEHEFPNLSTMLSKIGEG
ncbi:MAG: hypothetical protein RL197_505, partial [Actinomycetota bacterium]